MIPQPTACMSESPPSQVPLPFEAALERLQGIVRDLEDGKLGLQQSLTKFEEGIGLLRDCHKTLEQAEQRIEILIGMDANGEASTRPFDASATLEREDATPRKPGRRRATAAETPAPREPRPETPEPEPPRPETSRADGQRLF
jgi:exodeoxyribonuclease VII small subunit